MPEHSTFRQECAARGWDSPTEFLRVFDRTAALIGEPVTVTDRQLRRWREPDPPRPRARAWRVLHAMFGTSPLHLGFSGPEPPGTRPPRPDPYGGTSVDRRVFVSDSLGAAAGLTVSAPHAIGAAHLEELREGLHSLYSLDNAYGGGDVRSLAVRHLRRVRRVINTCDYPESIGHRLQSLVGETAEHCAWLFYDAEEQEPARQYWGEALTIATMLRDTSLETLVLASLSMQALHEGRARDGYELARAARQRAGGLRSPTLLSLVAAREARALAQLRDDTGARRTLAGAMRMADRAATGRHAPAPPWAAFHGHAELEFAQGLLYAEAGRHKASVPYLRAALAHQDRLYGRNRALYQITLVRGLLRADEVDEAAGEVMNALGHLAEVESGRVLSRLQDVRDALLCRDAAAAREAVEAIDAYRRGKTGYGGTS